MPSDRSLLQIPPIFLAEVELAQQAAAEYQQSGDPTHLQTAIAVWANLLSHPDFATADAPFQFAAYHDAAGAYFNHYGATNHLDDLHQAIAHLQQALVGVLGLLPLHTAWVEDVALPTGRCYELDRLMLTYAPNAPGLDSGQAIAARHIPERLMAIADPQPVRVDPLEYAESEVAVAASVLPQHQVLSHREATRDRVRTLLPDYTVLHCCCHGYVNWAEPLESGLVMAGDEILSLGDVLELRLVRARLAVLSACETGVAGVTLPDEVVSLPTGLLQAGFAGVAASLWAVEDVSTTMLMVRFYQLWRGAGWEPGMALRDAQRWLRDTTNREKAAYFRGLLRGGAEAGVDVGTVDRLYKTVLLAEPGERRLSRGFYWAAFGYVGL